MLSFF